MQGLINGNPIAAHDPALTPYIIRGDDGVPTIDPGKVTDGFRGRSQDLDNWYRSVAERYGFNFGQWTDDVVLGGKSDWGPPR